VELPNYILQKKIKENKKNYKKFERKSGAITIMYHQEQKQNLMTLNNVFIYVGHATWYMIIG